MTDYIQKIRDWSKEKELDLADPNKQMLKVMEEVGEVAGALAKGHMEELQLEIGDVGVTLIILAQQNGLAFESCLVVAYDKIKDREGEMINGVFVKKEDL